MSGTSLTRPARVISSTSRDALVPLSTTRTAIGPARPAARINYHITDIRIALKKAIPRS